MNANSTPLDRPYPGPVPKLKIHEPYTNGTGGKTKALLALAAQHRSNGTGNCRVIRFTVYFLATPDLN